MLASRSLCAFLTAPHIAKWLLSKVTPNRTFFHQEEFSFTQSKFFCLYFNIAFGPSVPLLRFLSADAING